MQARYTEVPQLIRQTYLLADNDVVLRTVLGQASTQKFRYNAPHCWCHACEQEHNEAAVKQVLLSIQLIAGANQ